jgi:hypothetical protein
LQLWETHSKSLEGIKAKYQRDLENRKNELQEELEQRKLTLQKELEQFKANVADELAAHNARRAYEYEARKRLYEQVEPLLFQLFEAAEGAFHIVKSLVRTQRMGDLPQWLSSIAHEPAARRYYVRSVIYRLFLPLTIYRLIQRSTTLVDLNLDPSIHVRYSLLKECYVMWTSDFDIAQLRPQLPYKPNEHNWEKLREDDPATYWRQGVPIGNLDRLIDSMVWGEGPSRTPMTFGQWETAIDQVAEAGDPYKILADIFLGFEFRSRDVAPAN